MGDIDLSVIRKKVIIENVCFSSVDELLLYKYCSFFFQAEDGIRDHCVTGVQTCALPICCYCCFSGCW